MIKINLLPVRQIIRDREWKYFLMSAGGILLGSVLLMVGLYLWFSFKVDELTSDKARHTGELAKLKEANKEITELNNKITRLTKQVDSIRKLTKTRDTPAQFMSALSYAIPEEVWLSSITKTMKNFSLDGVGADNTVVVKFVQNLSNIRQNFTEAEPFADQASNEQRFFGDVKLVQVVTAGGGPGAGPGSMSFKIIGSVR